MFDCNLHHIGESVGHYADQPTYRVVHLAFRCGCAVAFGTVEHTTACAEHAADFPAADFFLQPDGSTLHRNAVNRKAA